MKTVSPLLRLPCRCGACSTCAGSALGACGTLQGAACPRMAHIALLHLHCAARPILLCRRFWLPLVCCQQTGAHLPPMPQAATPTPLGPPASHYDGSSQPWSATCTPAQSTTWRWFTSGRSASRSAQRYRRWMLQLYGAADHEPQSRRAGQPTGQPASSMCQGTRGFTANDTQ